MLPACAPACRAPGQSDLRADDHALFSAEIRLHDLGGVTPAMPLLVHDFELRKVFWLSRTGAPVAFLQASGAADVIDVTVGDDDLLERKFVLREEGEDLRDVGRRGRRPWPRPWFRRRG